MDAEYVSRLLSLQKILEHKSCFLFGPRQTGKSSFVENELKDCIVIDLLDDEIFLRLQQNSKALLDYISNPKKIVVIDEIQRVPKLLNEVHRLIEKQKIKFLLTGSSARKLRRKGVNLLGGRARARTLHPLVSAELEQKFELMRALRFGLIPSIYFSDDPWDDLKSYVSEYLKEEIIAEAATRNIPAFARFLEIAALRNGQLLNYETVSSQSMVPRATVQSYYQILRDTLIGRNLSPFKKTRKREPIRTDKFYFFDNGVVNYLKKQKEISENQSEFGFTFEAWAFHELSSYQDYFGNHELQYWRSQSDLEVDFLIDESIAVEVKSTKKVDRNDFKGLIALAEEIPLKRQIVLCRESVPRKVGKIEIMPYSYFSEMLWNHKLF